MVANLAYPNFVPPGQRSPITPPHLQIVKFADLDTPAASATRTGKLPVSHLYHGILLKFSASGTAATVAQLKAQVAEIVVKVDSKEILRATPTFLYDLQLYQGTAINVVNKNGIIPIWFQNPVMDDPLGKLVTGLGTANLQSLTVEVEFTGTITNVAKCEIYGVVSPYNRDLTQFLRISRRSFTQGSTGEMTINDLDVNELAGLLDMHIGIGSNPGVFADVRLTRDNYDLVADVPPDVMDCILETYGRQSIVASYYHIDFAPYGLLGEFVDLRSARALKLVIDWSTAPTAFDIYFRHVMNLQDF